MSEVARVTFRPSMLGNKASRPVDDTLGSLIERALAGLDEPTRARIGASDQCTVVNHGCGTCANGGALVEYFCGSGGSEPDYTRCENCD